jgi:hypothetical protein
LCTRKDDLTDEEIRRVALMPENEKELKKLTLFVLSLISSKKFIKNDERYLEV